MGIVNCAVANAENKNDISPKFKNAVENSFFDLIYLANLQSNMLKEVKTLLKASEVPYIVFKGAVLKQSYPVPESRVMGDIDILINECDRNKVKKLLTSNGFDCIKQNGPVYNYVKNNVLFEIHTKLINHYYEEPFCNAFD